MSQAFRLLLLFLSVPLWADPLPVKEAFQPQLIREDSGLALRIHFAAGYDLYRDKTQLSAHGQPISWQASPPAHLENDPYLGPQYLWTTPPTLHFADPQSDTLELRTQGCQKGVLCYPPTTWHLRIPPAPKAQAAPRSVAQLFHRDEVLPVARAFSLTLDRDPQQNWLTITMASGVYLYRDRLQFWHDGRAFTPQLPPAQSHQDAFRGEQKIYRGRLKIAVPQGALKVRYQGCLEGKICYPPQEWQTEGVPVAAPEPPQTPAVTSADPVQKLITGLNANYGHSLWVIYLLGLTLSFTACVYPLIPIVTALVLGKNARGLRAYALLATYVGAMGLALGVLGAIFAGFHVNLQLVLQTPWVSAVVAGFFVLLALSMFDVYDLHTPRFLQAPLDKISRRQKAGSFLGAALSGALSVLVVSPCATPVMTALLFYSAHDTPFQGAFALFVFGVGMGTPLFLFASAFRRFMPKVGAWMGWIKKGFGFAMLALAWWLVVRLLPEVAAWRAWALYALLLGVALQGGRYFLRRFCCALAFAFCGGLLLHAENLNRPFAVPHAAPHFQVVADEAAARAAIAQSARPVMLDFYADWCVSCRKWEAEIWHNPRFFAPLSAYTLLKVDMSTFTPAHKALLNTLGLSGPPALLIYPAHGTLSKPEQKVIGETNPEAFSKLLKDLKSR